MTSEPTPISRAFGAMCEMPLHVAASGRLGRPGTDIKNGRNWTFLRSFGSLEFDGRVFCIYSCLFLSMKIIGGT